MAKLLVDVLDCRKLVRQTVQTASDYAHLSTLLDGLLEKSAGDISHELALATQQCLMKDFSLQNERNVGIYSMWRAHHQKEGAL